MIIVDKKTKVVTIVKNPKMYLFIMVVIFLIGLALVKNSGAQLQGNTHTVLVYIQMALGVYFIASTLNDFRRRGRYVLRFLRRKA